MADIELVIKIDEEIYNHTQEYEFGGFNQENDTKLFIAIKNGTPLPKGHGRLGDLDKVKNKMLYSYDIGAEIETYGTEEVINNIFDDAQTIIAADPESEG